MQHQKSTLIRLTVSRRGEAFRLGRLRHLFVATQPEALLSFARWEANWSDAEHRDLACIAHQRDLA